ncbi:centrosomal protein of 164 kDa isoform X2 [Neodiprion lecontei]|uniref:Centrosomal protein of 164 kDa isoform X2 n=1 Tax=Neodiprion lecontei TaxID=441921 RepID=A0ABM3GI23_NEOLC|nr:centrosomal protein of 164 kDa isoform X2 [Neodiprion lecontei]
MSVSQEIAATVVCREVFDESSHPSHEEVVDYATRLGIDPEAEPHLLGLAKDGLMAALPKGWSPCFHEATGAWYYYQASTGTTTWEHPLDSVYKELVENARKGNRQPSIDEDSKATTKDLESQEDVTSPKEIAKTLSRPKLPAKLVPLRKSKTELLGARRNEFKVEKTQPRKENDTVKLDNSFSSSSDRASRDYTNLRFQDPNFYESPKLLEVLKASEESEESKVRGKELDLQKVLKRSESLSPRYEQEWEQLSSKFGSEENIIDIDKLSINSLNKSDAVVEKSEEEKQQARQSSRIKELTLSGGGSMFLKSNRSRDANACGSLDEDVQNDFYGVLRLEDKNTSSVGDRPKSILREKNSEDDDKPVEEERKSVRFDLEKEVDVKFTYSGSEEEWDTESDEPNMRISATVTMKNLMSFEGEDLELEKSAPTDVGSCMQGESVGDKLPDLEEPKKDNLGEKSKMISKQPKIVGKRFLVENVTENEHFNQTSKDKSCSDATDGGGDYVPSKFENVRNIDLLSKSENESTTTLKSTESRSSILDEIRRSKEMMLESMKRSDMRAKNELQKEKDDAYHLMKIKLDLESARNQREKARARSQMTKNFQAVKSAVRREREKEIQDLKDDFQIRYEDTKTEYEAMFLEEKGYLEENIKERLAELREDMKQREQLEVQNLVAEMDKTRVEELNNLRSELETCYEKEKQEILKNLRVELEEKKLELLEHRNREIEKLKSDFEKSLEEEKALKLVELDLGKQHAEKVKALKTKLEKEFEDTVMELRLQQREKISKVTEDHEVSLAEILRDFRTEEDLARKEYKQRLEEVRASFSRDIEKEMKKQSERLVRPDSMDYEKIRCEKRLVEDKYKTLKEKYLKLKNDVRLAVESRSRRKEANATASETERSTSARTKTERTESVDQKAPLKKTQSITTLSENVSHNDNGAEESDGQKIAGFSKTPSALKLAQSKLESDDTTTASEQNSNLLKKKKLFTKKAASTSKLNNNVENPVENIRKQLEKLEDLGDQLPSNENAYTLRYPFQDQAPANASSDIEFFRHRIHVERDSVRRAREALHQQRNLFQGRQRAWKQRSVRATLEQLVQLGVSPGLPLQQEERELSDMEVSLHRTRSLLGEKVIHLRHLERSLERVANAKRNKNEQTAKSDELTLSDISSASSGFSSTDLETDTFIGKSEHYQESTEIIASLENLNSEIREIWGVLNKRQDNSVPPPPTLMYSDLRWLPYQQLTTQANNVPAFGTPNIQSNILSQLTGSHPPTTTTQNIIAQYGPTSGYTTSVGNVERTTSNLMERTRNLRDWLRQARVESSDLVSPGQATL